MKIKQLFCHLKSFGKHVESTVSFSDEYYCVKCNLYLGTNYNQKLSCDKRRSLYNMWWESGGKSYEC